jgi:hypothetical protein
MVIAAAQGEVLLGPNDLSARQQPAAGQIGGDDIAVQRSADPTAPVTGCVGGGDSKTPANLDETPWPVLGLTRGPPPTVL